MSGLFTLWTTRFDLRLFLFFWRLWMGSARCRFSPRFGLRFDLIIVVVHIFVLLWRLWFAGFGLKLGSSGCGPLWVLCLLLDTLKTLGHYWLLRALGSVCRIQRFGSLLSSSLSSWLHGLLTLAELPIRLKWLAWAHWPVQVGSRVGGGSLHWLIRRLFQSPWLLVVFLLEGVDIIRLVAVLSQQIGALVPVVVLATYSRLGLCRHWSWETSSFKALFAIWLLRYRTLCLQGLYLTSRCLCHGFWTSLLLHSPRHDIGWLRNLLSDVESLLLDLQAFACNMPFLLVLNHHWFTKIWLCWLSKVIHVFTNEIALAWLTTCINLKCICWCFRPTFSHNWYRPLILEYKAGVTFSPAVTREPGLLIATKLDSRLT